MRGPRLCPRCPDCWTASWWKRAACRGVDANLFHPGKGGDSTLTLRHAKIICGDCPVAASCLAHALTHNESGVWGGTSEKQRRDIRRVAHRTRILTTGDAA